MARRTSALGAVALTVLLGACAGRGGPTDPHALAALAPHAPDAQAPPAAHVAFKVPAFAALPPRAPMTLTTSDGAGLELRALSSKTVVYGPLAHTEVHLRFFNPENRQREGRFSISLPQHALVTRLAMKIDGKLTEADVTETARAREVYEEVVHRRRDPLLVEQHGTNELTARVFPIPAIGDKEIVVGWVAEVGPASPIVVPLRGLPEIAHLDVEVIEGTTVLAKRRSGSVAPAADVRVAVREGSPSAVRAGDVVVARVVVPRSSFEQPASPIGKGAIVLVDTSASRAGDLETDLLRLHAIVKELAREEPKASLVVAAFDQGVEVAYRGTLAGFDDAAIAKLRAHGALGASDPKGALAWAASEAASTKASRLVLVSDGLATGGESGATATKTVAKSLQDAGIERLDAIPVGDVRDETSLRALVTAGFASPGMVIEGGANAEPTTTVASRLVRAVRSHLVVSAPGASRVWPRVLEGVQPGDEVQVLVEMPHATSPKLSIAIGGATVAIDVPEGGAAPAAVVDKIDATSKIASLVDTAARLGWTDSARATVVGIAKAKKVASPFTSFIVVESEEDRRALFAPKPASRAPAVVQPPVPVAGILPRPPPASASASASASDDLFAHPPPIPPPAPPTVTKRIVARAHVTKAPMIRMGSTHVSGRLPPEIIQRIVRQNFGRFRACYEEGLRRRGPTLTGRIATKFVIGRDGIVRDLALAESDMNDADVESCVTKAFGGLQFPVPEGGIVTVVYPIAFRPPGSEDEAPPPRSLLPSPIHPRRSSPWEGSSSTYEPPPLLAWTGDYHSVQWALSKGRVADALGLAAAARARDSRDVFALVALGEALEAAGLPEIAQRAFGSIADLEPNDAESLRSAAVRLEHAAGKPTPLSIELLRRAVDDRPDIPHGHHLLAVALLRIDAHAEAFEALAKGIAMSYAPRYQQGIALLRRDLELVSMAWIAASEPARTGSIRARAHTLLGHPLFEESLPSTTYALSWETDASSMSLHVPLAADHIAWGNDGYGPDAWVLRRDDRSPMPLVVAFNRRGPMGHPLGVVHVMEHDGRGHVTVEPRPFAVINEGAEVSLGLSL